jgi:hypothetical protein
MNGCIYRQNRGEFFGSTDKKEECYNSYYYGYYYGNNTPR